MNKRPPIGAATVSERALAKSRQSPRSLTVAALLVRVGGQRLYESRRRCLKGADR